MTDKAEELETNPLEMSDDDLLNMPVPEDEPKSAEEASADTPEQTPDEETSDGMQETQGAEETSGQEIADDEETPPADKADGGGADEADASAADGATSDTDSEKETAATIDYKAEYERLMAPFKANGREMQVNSVDDIRTLMQMGANYSKKMAGLKPNLKLMKMLERNELLDEEKLTFLIDLQKKDPAAIAQFLKTSGIDPLDIDVDQDPNYKPSTYTVDDNEIELDQVLTDIESSPGFNETIDIISNKWDDSSRRLAINNPNLIKLINEQVETGIYQEIYSIVENERALGRLSDMSDLEAYKHVGDVIQANGGFGPPPDQRIANGSFRAPAPAATPAPTQRENQELNERRRAASSTRSSPETQPINDYNPLALSDEDFENLAGGKYI